MIEAIKQIGEYALEKEKKSVNAPLEILIDNPKNKDTKNISFIALVNKNNKFEYKEINKEEYTESKLIKYLYKKGSPNGTDMTPTAMITSVDKTFNNKIINWFKEYKEIGSDENINFLVRTGNCIKENSENILKDLKEKCDKKSNIVSLKIDGKYIGDYPIFQNILVGTAKENFYSKYGVTSKSENQTCSICTPQKKEVYGFVDTYKFYTVDKPGFVSGGFQQKYAWKNYPTCLNCALILEEGKKHIGNNFMFNFYGFKYLLIPKFVSGIKKEVKKEIFKIIEQQKDPKIIKKEIAKLTNAEDEILKLMSEQKNYLNVNFLFYDAPKGYNGSVFNILIYIEDILPSRLKTLFDTKGNMDKIDIFKECLVTVYEDKKKIGEKPLEFNFGVLRTFLPRISDNRTYNKYFLDIVNRIFTGKPIDYHFLMSFIIQKIREEFINGYSTKISTLKGFMLLNYLNELKILKNFEGVKKMDEDKTKTFDISGGVSEKINSFFDEFADFFNSDVKKAIFLEGVLVQKLLNIQRLPDVSNAGFGKEPFRHRLKGLKLDEKHIKKLLLEAQNKLEEYGKNYYRSLETMISGYLVSSGNKWEINNDEISYYFVLGMNLAYLFKSENKEEKESEENE